MAPLLPVAGTRLLHDGTASDTMQAAQANASSNVRDEDGEADGDYKAIANDSATHSDRRTRQSWEEYLTPQLRALAESQIRHPPPHHERPNLRRVKPDIPELNSWLRPMPHSRVHNATKKWYATLLDKIHPPLPDKEWERLRCLANGELQEDREPCRVGSSKRNASSALEMLATSGKPNFKRAPSEGRSKRIDRRYMQRLWAEVFEQCPKMDWDLQKQMWTVTWGHRALYASRKLLPLQVTRRTPNQRHGNSSRDARSAMDDSRATAQ